MIDDLSSFMQCATATKINDEVEYNYRVVIHGCDCGIFEEALLVTATSEFEAMENAWVHIQQQKEKQYL